jgi:hypothetical protein
MNFLKWYRKIVKIAIPVVFFACATWPKSYWLAGVMTILVLFLYATEKIKLDS